MNYFSLENYGQPKPFKSVNETIKPRRKRNAAVSLSQTKDRYQYSGMGEHRFLHYSTDMSGPLQKLYLRFTNSVGWS